MDGIYTNGLNRSATEGIRDKGTEAAAPEFHTGDILEGVVTSVSDRVSINFSGKDFSFPSETVRNAREGEIRTYKIMEASGASIVLKEIGNAKAGGEPGGIRFTTVETGLQTLNGSVSGELASGTVEDEKLLDELANRVTEEDKEALEDEGMTMDRFNLERLERALERIKAQHELVARGIEGQKQTIRSRREFAEDAARKNVRQKLSGSAMTEVIAKRLEACDLPVTKSNVSRIAEAMKLAEEAQYMTEASFSYLIGNQLTPTIENCYKAVHAGAAKTAKLPEAVFQELMPQIQKVIAEAAQGGEATADGISGPAGKRVNSQPVGSQAAGTENQVAGTVNQTAGATPQAALEDARWLIEKELPLTAENLQYKQELDQIKAACESGTLDAEAVLSAAVETLVNRGEPKQTNLSVLRKREEARLLLTEEAAARMKQTGITVDTEAIRERIEGLKRQEAEYYQKQLGTAGELDGKAAADVLTETLAAADTVRNSSANLLAVTFTSRYSQTLVSLQQTAISLNTAAQGITSGTTAQGTAAQIPAEQTAQGIGARGLAAEAAYEPLMTAPRRDMGDSIQKAFRSVDNILQELNLEQTQANQRAVRILGYNSIPLTEENILSMKAYDAQVTGTMERLQPGVTVELIRKGINPLTLPLAELAQETAAIAKELGSTPEERFSEYLVKLDRKKELTAEERESYIGIYRTLYQIEKTDGAAIGALVQSGRELTLKNLLTETRTMKNISVDARVDDAFGAAESVSFAGRNIEEQVNAAYLAAGQPGNRANLPENRAERTAATGGLPGNSAEQSISNTMQSVEQLLTHLSPDRLEQLQQSGTTEDMTPEQLAEELAKTSAGETDRDYQSEQLRQLRELAGDSADSLKFLDTLGIENTIANLSAARAILQGMNRYRRLNEIAAATGAQETETAASGAQGAGPAAAAGAQGAATASAQKAGTVSLTEATEAMGTRETLTALCERAEAGAQRLMEQLYTSADLSAEEAGALRELKAASPLASELTKKEYFEIPISDESGVLGLRLTVVHGSRENGKFRIQMELAGERMVQVEARIRPEQADLLITTNDRSLRDALKSSTGQLNERLEAAGIAGGQVSVAFEAGGSAKALMPEPVAAGEEAEAEEGISTSRLYTAAKETVLYIRQLS